MNTPESIAVPADYSRDELRRQVRDLDRLHRDTEREHQSLVRALFDGSTPDADRAGTLLGGLDRRGFFRLGGLTVAAGLVLAACGDDSSTPTQIGISGESPGFVPLEDKPVTDIVILRTASSLEYSVMDAYRKLLDNGFIEDPAIADLLRVFHDHHWSHADALVAATVELGGTPCASLNPKITGDLINPLLGAVAASGAARGEDSKALAHALENLAGATYQSAVPSLSRPELRRTAMSVGAVEGRHAAVLAMAINPAVLVGSGVAAVPAAEESEATTTAAQNLGSVPDATTTTVVQTAQEANVIIAVPSTFGSLAAIPLTVGPANETGVRRTVNLETPSLNSLMYEDEAC